MQELTANVDAYFKSVYVTKQPDAAGGKLGAGPIWDFDLAFGNVTFREGNRHDIWTHGANRFMPWSRSPYTPPSFVSRVPTYWEKLWADRAFQGRLRCRWEEMHKGAFASAAIAARIDGWGTKLAAAQARDQALWKSLSMDVNSNAYLPATYAAELTASRASTLLLEVGSQHEQVEELRDAGAREAQLAGQGDMVGHEPALDGVVHEGEPPGDLALYSMRTPRTSCSARRSRPACWVSSTVSASGCNGRGHCARRSAATGTSAPWGDFRRARASAGHAHRRAS
jgi:hypothetical protein